MIKAIFNVNTADDGRTITFAVMTDADGANEFVSITLNGQKFATLVQVGPLETATQFIPLTEHPVPPYVTGRYKVSLVAESSGNDFGFLRSPTYV